MSTWWHRRGWNNDHAVSLYSCRAHIGSHSEEHILRTHGRFLADTLAVLRQARSLGSMHGDTIHGQLQDPLELRVCVAIGLWPNFVLRVDGFLLGAPVHHKVRGLRGAPPTFGERLSTRTQWQRQPSRCLPQRELACSITTQRARSVSMRSQVWMVSCQEPLVITPIEQWSWELRTVHHEPLLGISCSARETSLRPTTARRTFLRLDSAMT